MSGVKQDLVRKHLVAAGLNNDACTKYVQLLRRFLAARLTKAKFELEMLKILPREKIAAHNAIIKELLHRAQQKREGVPDLPNPAFAAEKATQKPAPSHKRPRPVENEVEQHEPRANGVPAALSMTPKPPVEKQEKVLVKLPTEDVSVPATRGAAPAAASAVNRGGSGGGAGPGVQPPRPPPIPMIPSADVQTYNCLPYFPVRPGQALDLELFLKLRQRMKKVAVEDMGLSGGVKDDAVALLLHGLEAHVKSLMEAGVRQRAAREALRPRGTLVCGPVGGYDFREAALRNSSMLGDEAAFDLERLTMLLY
jgi:Transcriptional regulator of RNA polII, SAGA, subunit